MRNSLVARRITSSMAELPIFLAVATQPSAMARASVASALIDGRMFVVPDDIKRLTIPVLSHRVVTKGYIQGDSRGAAEGIIMQLVDEVSVPT